MKALLVLLPLLTSVTFGAEPTDVAFVARRDGTEQRYVELLPANFQPTETHDVLLVLHGHGADRWQFIREDRDECRGVRAVAARHNLILIAPDYRARTSWMGPQAEADVVQIIDDLKQRHLPGRVFLAGGSMGGTAALTFAVLHPELIAGVCSLNGTANLVEYDRFQESIQAAYGGTKTDVPDEYLRRSAEFFPDQLTMPIACTTGGLDDVVPPASVLRLIAVLQQSQRNVLSLHRAAGGHATNYEDTCAALEYILSRAQE